MLNFSGLVKSSEKKHYKDFINAIPDAKKLELQLNPTVIEHDGGMSSTANTNVQKKIIHVDISQPPLKTALSYAYELKNLENSAKYEHLNQEARKRKIAKKNYVDQYLLLEAQAVYYRCQVFRSLNDSERTFPCKKEYLEIFDSNPCVEEAIRKLAIYIQEHGIVRRSHSVKKFYADCFDFYAGKKTWPTLYDKAPDSTVVILDNAPRSKRQKIS